MGALNLDDVIRKVPDFPKDGILFYDITSIFTQPDAFAFCVNTMYDLYCGKRLDGIAAVESRGFLFAAPLAVKLHLPLLLIRKKGKLPGKTYACEYALEYGSATIEAHQADIKRGGQYLVIDDLIATGGTLAACKNILNQGGASVAEFCAVIGLSEFPYQKALSPTPVTTLITY